MDSAAIVEVFSVDRKEGVEPSHVISKEEEVSEDTVDVEGCATLVDMSGNEDPLVVDVVVVIFGRESSVGLGRIKVEDADSAGILLQKDVALELSRGIELVDRVWLVVGGDSFVLLKYGG